MGKKDKAGNGAGSGAAGAETPPAAAAPVQVEKADAGAAAAPPPETAASPPSPAAEPASATTGGETPPGPEADRKPPPDGEPAPVSPPAADAAQAAGAAGAAPTSDPAPASDPASASEAAPASGAGRAKEPAAEPSPPATPAPETSAAPHPSPEPSPEPAPPSAAPAPEPIPSTRAHAPELQELWLALARRRWNSIVVVPADRSGSSEAVAKALAEVGKELAEDPVTAITVSRLEYDQARTLTDLQLLVGKERERLDAEGPDPVVDVGRRRSEPITVVPPSVDGEGPSRAIALVPRTRLVISIPAVVSEPLGVAVAQYADGVVLTVQMGSTRLEEARRTIELIGRDRILGCFLVP